MIYLQSIVRLGYIQSSYKVLSRSTCSNLPPEDLRKSFQKAQPKIIHDVISGKSYLIKSGLEDKIRKACERNRKVLDCVGGITLLHAYNLLEKTGRVTSDSRQHAFVLACAVEMVHCHNMMMERSQEIEADLLRSFVYIMLEEHFKSSTRNNDFLEIFNKAFLCHALGRDIEYAACVGAKHLDFNDDQYNILCEYKTAYPFFTLPLSLAMPLADILACKKCSVDKVCSEMGKLYQMKKDYNDCFGGETVIGTSGIDIQQGKCTWLAVEALRRFTPHQRVVFGACYGGAAPAHVERVKLLYKQVQLPAVFKERQSAMVDNIRTMITESEKDGAPAKVLFKLLEDIVRDEKVCADHDI